jgi:hypothetical protein
VLADAPAAGASPQAGDGRDWPSGALPGAPDIRIGVPEAWVGDSGLLVPERGAKDRTKFLIEGKTASAI